MVESGGDQLAGGVVWSGVALLLLLSAWGGRIYAPVLSDFVRGAGRAPGGWCGVRDLPAAFLLVGWFAMVTVSSFTATAPRTLTPGDMANGALIYGCILLGLAGLLMRRSWTIPRAFGLAGSSPGEEFRRGAGYLLAAYPLLLLLQVLLHAWLGWDVQPQEVVQFLRETPDGSDRWLLILLAVVVAPVAEEVIFRGYLYPVARHYLGRGAALGGTALFFAAVHGHAPSLPALTLLAVCLTLVYERTGSLYTPVFMHALFNAVSVTAILLMP